MRVRHPYPGSESRGEFSTRTARQANKERNNGDLAKDRYGSHLPNATGTAIGKKQPPDAFQNHYLAFAFHA